MWEVLFKWWPITGPYLWPSLTPHVHSYCSTMHTHVVHCTLRRWKSNLYMYSTWFVHRARRSVAGPTNNQWEYVYRFWIWYISINKLHIEFWQVQKHQGATTNGHTVVVHAYAHTVHTQCTQCTCTVCMDPRTVMSVGVCWSSEGYS